MGADWLRWLVKERTDLGTLISGWAPAIRRRTRTGWYYRAGGASGAAFGLVAVAGELATHAGFTGWQEGKLNRLPGSVSRRGAHPLEVPLGIEKNAPCWDR